MKAPDVETVFPQVVNGLTFRFLAYRTLTEAEMLSGIRRYLVGKGKKAAPGSTVTLISTFR